MVEAVRDANGWPIARGARVYVPPRILAGLNHKVKAIRGVVGEVHEDRVEIIEFGSFSTRTVRPEDVKVQRGDTGESEEFYRIREALRRHK